MTFFIAFLLFVIGASAPLFGWTLGDFYPTVWGLAFLAAGLFLVPYKKNEEK